LSKSEELPERFFHLQNLSKKRKKRKKIIENQIFTMLLSESFQIIPVNPMKYFYACQVHDSSNSTAAKQTVVTWQG